MRDIEKFKPQLITNDKPNLDEIEYPVYTSKKHHGIRILIHPKHDKILGRSMKPIPNIQFQEKFYSLLQWCKKRNTIIEGEAHIDEAISDDMVHFLNTIDLTKMSKTSKDHIEKNIKSGKFSLPEEAYYYLPESLNIYVFDMLMFDSNDVLVEVNFRERHINATNILCDFKSVEIIDQHLFENKQQVMQYYEYVIHKNDEGVVLRYDKPYKFNRSTLKEGLIYKLIPTPTFDARIVKINQATVVREGAEKKTNELGRSVTSKKKDDRIPIEQAKDFQVEMRIMEPIHGNKFRVIEADDPRKIPTVIISFGVSMKGFDHEQRKEVWNNQEKYLGRMIEFQCKEYRGIGMPKSAVFIRFRDDK